MKEKLLININDVTFLPTAHTSGIKKVLFSGSDHQSSLTQFAYGKLMAGETIPGHEHPTMEEFFYFLQGRGYYWIGGEKIDIAPGSAVRIPAKSNHRLEAIETLEFVYFGVAI